VVGPYYNNTMVVYLLSFTRKFKKGRERDKFTCRKLPKVLSSMTYIGGAGAESINHSRMT
jgi:hypothetical protein